MRILQETGYLWNKHFLPHDAAHKRLSSSNKSTQKMLEDLGLRNTVIVPVTPSINAGIQLTRQYFTSCYFDEVGCKEGLQRLSGYKKKWMAATGRWSDEPCHDSNSEGADAFRQFAQAKAGGLITMAGSTRQTVTAPFRPSDRGMGLMG